MRKRRKPSARKGEFSRKELEQMSAEQLPERAAMSVIDPKLLGPGHPVQPDIAAPGPATTTTDEEPTA